MTPRISLIIGVAVAALTVVPAAFSEGRLADSPEPDGVAYFYANERATLAQQYGDAFARTQHVDFWNYDPQSGAKIADASPGVAPRDLATLYSAEGIAQQDDGSSVPDGVAYFYANERATLATVTASSGRDIEWPQLGIGFGLGILLVAGLWLAMRMTKLRRLAH